MKADFDSWRNPLLDDFLRTIRFRSGLYFRPQFRAPWGISVARNCIVFHIVDQGNCPLEVNGMTEPMRLSEGDFVVVTRGDAHIMRDRLSTPAADFFDLVKTHRFAENPTFRAGGKGSITTLVCGGAHLEAGANNSLIGMLPPVLYVRRTEDGAQHWLGLTTSRFWRSCVMGGTGAKEIITRLIDVLFIRAVHEYFDQNIETAESGRLAAVRDGRIGRALAMLTDIHSRHGLLMRSSSRGAFPIRFRGQVHGTGRRTAAALPHSPSNRCRCGTFAFKRRQIESDRCGFRVRIGGSLRQIFQTTNRHDTRGVSSCRLRPLVSQ